jgi:hypothetical protein
MTLSFHGIRAVFLLSVGAFCFHNDNDGGGELGEGKSKFYHVHVFQDIFN